MYDLNYEGIEIIQEILKMIFFQELQDIFKMNFIKKLIFLFEKNLLGHYKCNFILGLFFGLKKTNPLAVELLLINLTQLHTEIHIDDGLTTD
jgi:hypothetical protein